MKLKYILYAFTLLGIVGWGPFTAPGADLNAANWVDTETRIISAAAPNLSPKVLKLSLTAYLNARRRGLDRKELLTIVDYSKPSTERRLWVVDVHNQRVLFNTWVAHGKNSGDLSSKSFSNQPRSLKSSLGVFLTAETYSGHNGYSLRLQGLERGINDLAYSRAIVFHGADYANPAVVQHLGRLGRSWGCLAVGRNVITSLANTIRNNTLVVAYYPDQNWLSHSTFLRSNIV